MLLNVISVVVHLYCQFNCILASSQEVHSKLLVVLSYISLVSTTSLGVQFLVVQIFKNYMNLKIDSNFHATNCSSPCGAGFPSNYRMDTEAIKSPSDLMDFRCHCIYFNSIF